MCIRRTLLANTLYSYLERSSIQLLAYSFARSFLMSTFGRCMSAYRERFLLNLRGRSIYTSAQFREAVSRESVALSGRPQRKDAIRERERETGSGGSSTRIGTIHIVMAIYLSSSYSFYFLRFRRPFLVFTHALLKRAIFTQR